MRKPAIKAPLCAAFALLSVFSTKALSLSPDHVSLANFVPGNTLLVTNKLGPTLIQMVPGGTWTAIAPQSGAQTTGVWRISGEQLCVRQTGDLPPGKVVDEHCVQVASKSFGEDWERSDPVMGKLVYRWLPGLVRELPTRQRPN